MTPEAILPLIGACICGDVDCDIPFGYCHCKCGRKTAISDRTGFSERRIKGLPVRFIKAHTIRIPRRSEDAKPFKIDGVYCRLIALTRGYYAIVNMSRYEYICRFRWKVMKLKKGIYATAKYMNTDTMKPRHIMMHNLILFPELLEDGLPWGYLGDHRNGMGLDNRDANLRVATYRQNTQNMKIGKQNTSGYKGVTWNKNERKWFCQMVINGKTIIFYRGPSKIKAAETYDYYARLHFGEFCCVNFPRPGERSAI